MVRIAVDAMGGDQAPAAVVEGAVLACNTAELEVILVGDEAKIRAELARLGAGREPRLTVHHTTQVVEMGDAAAHSVRTKKESSARRICELVKAAEADAALSAGNSGALLAAATVVLGKVPGVERPAAVAFLPTLARPVTLLDAGANVEIKPLHLAQFALLGEVYTRRVLHTPSPRVGILSNGEERNKGTALTRAAVEILEGMPLQDFRGHLEAQDVFSGKIDVVATDGFTGNVMLKTAEGTAVAFGRYLEKSVEASSMARLGAMLMRPVLDALRRKLDYAEVGGAPLIGCEGTVLLAHGRSGPRAICNAIRAAAEASKVDLRDEIAAVCSNAAERAAVL